MGIFVKAFDWLTDPANWSGTNGIPTRIFLHVELSGLAVGVAVLVAVPIGLYVGHTRRFEFLAVSIANVGRAIPSFAIMVIAFQLFLNLLPTYAFGFWPTFIALFLLSVPPILTNTYVGVQNVEADTVEAARGMGLTGMQVLRRLEVPLAAPLILTGIRIAAVAVVATATLAAFIGGNNLGRYIVDGFHTQDFGEMVGGALLVATLAFLTELAFGLLTRVLSPRLRSVGPRRRRPREPAELVAEATSGPPRWVGDQPL